MNQEKLVHIIVVACCILKPLKCRTADLSTYQAWCFLQSQGLHFIFLISLQIWSFTQVKTGAAWQKIQTISFDKKQFCLAYKV